MRDFVILARQNAHVQLRFTFKWEPFALSNVAPYSVNHRFILLPLLSTLNAGNGEFP
jgi:hypothetical protein